MQNSISNSGSVPTIDEERKFWRVVKAGAHVRSAPGGREIKRLAQGFTFEEVDSAIHKGRRWIAFLLNGNLTPQPSARNIFRPSSSSVSARDEVPVGKTKVWTVVEDKKTKEPKLVQCNDIDDDGGGGGDSSSRGTNKQVSFVDRPPSSARGGGSPRDMRRQMTIRTRQLVVALEQGNITAQEYEIIHQTKLRAIERDNPRLAARRGGSGSGSGQRAGAVTKAFSAGAAHLARLRAEGAVSEEPVEPVAFCKMTFAFTLGALNWALEPDLASNDGSSSGGGGGGHGSVEEHAEESADTAHAEADSAEDGAAPSTAAGDAEEAAGAPSEPTSSGVPVSEASESAAAQPAIAFNLDGEAIAARSPKPDSTPAAAFGPQLTEGAREAYDLGLRTATVQRAQLSATAFDLGMKMGMSSVSRCLCWLVSGRASAARSATLSCKVSTPRTWTCTLRRWHCTRVVAFAVRNFATSLHVGRRNRHRPRQVASRRAAALCANDCLRRRGRVFVVDPVAIAFADAVDQ